MISRLILFDLILTVVIGKQGESSNNNDYWLNPCSLKKAEQYPPGKMVQEDLNGNGGSINLKCTGGSIKIHKILYSCKIKHVSDPKQLAIVKKKCDCQTECKVEANRKTFGNSECPGTEDSKMKLWFIYSCDGGKDDTIKSCSKKSTKQELLASQPVKVPENGGWINMKCTGGLINIQSFFGCQDLKVNKKIEATVNRKCECRSECRIDTKTDIYKNCPLKNRLGSGLIYTCIGGKQETTIFDPKVGEVRRCACDRQFKENPGEMKQEDLPGNGGWINMKCTMKVNNNVLTWGSITIHKVLYSCKHKEVSDPKQLAIVKKQCECCGECRIESNRKTFGETECPGTEDAKMNLWIVYSCDGGKSVTDETTKFIPGGTDVPENPQVSCEDNGCGAHATCSQGTPRRCECQAKGQTHPNCCPEDCREEGLCSGGRCRCKDKQRRNRWPRCTKVQPKCNPKCTGGADCKRFKGKWSCFCKRGLRYSGGKCVSMCDPECTGGAQCLHSINNGKFSCYCNKGLHYIGGKCVSTPKCNPGCKGGGVCIPNGRKSVCSCSRGLSYTGQGCAKCEAAPRGGAKKSRDIPLDGGWIDINCGTGGCITLHKVMAGCSMKGDQTIHIPKVAHCNGKQTCNIQPTSSQFGVSCNNGWRRMWITWSCNSGRDKTTHHIPSRPTCRPGCKGGSVCRRIEGRDVCSCNRGLRYTGQGCAKCEAAPRAGAMKSRDIPLDGGSININCGTGGCITLNKVMAGCNPGANIHIPKVAYCEGKQTCSIKPTSAHFGVNCTGWRRMWITWACNSGRDRTRQYIPPKRIQYAKT